MPIRLPSEWEYQDYIMLVFPKADSDWQHSIKEIQQSYIKFIKIILRYQKCVVLCDDLSKISQILPKSKNLKLIQIDTNDTWIRDFGGICVYANNELKILNFEFNAWGEKFEYSLDNALNQELKNRGFLKNLTNINFILEGGSIETNGNGTALTTAKCIFNKNRNPTLRRDEIIKKIKKFFGLEKLIILKNGGLIGDDTDSHIDTLARFIDKDTIAYAKCYDKNDEHYEVLKKMEEELKQTNFKLLPLPLPCPKYFKHHRLPATYLNFIFINSALIVPTYKDKNDKIVIEILQKFLPDSKIIGIDASVFIREHGSLHCATMNFYKERV